MLDDTYLIEPVHKSTGLTLVVTHKWIKYEGS